MDSSLLSGEKKVAWYDQAIDMCPQQAIVQARALCTDRDDGKKIR
ncbi:hypothetical protein TRP66_04805 [Pseudomonas sp. JDS28PS106]